MMEHRRRACAFRQYFSSSKTVTLSGPGRFYDPENDNIAYTYQKNIPLWLIGPNGSKRASPNNMQLIHTPERLNPASTGFLREFSILYSGEQ